MKYILLTCLLLTLLPMSAETIQHRLYAIDNGANTLIYLDQITPEASWTVNIPAGSRDLQLLDGQRLLVSHGNGAREYDRVTGAGLEWQVDRYKDVQSAIRTDNGETWLLTRKGMIYIVNPDGSENRTLKLPVPKKANLRLLRFTTGLTISNDSELVISANTPRAILRYTIDGTAMKPINLPGKGYKAELLPNGTFYTSTGDESAVLEVDTDGTILTTFGGKVAHPNVGLDFCSGWQPLANGHMMMTNWLGHKKHGTGPHLFEFNGDNQIVWWWEDHDAAKQITNVLVVE